MRRELKNVIGAVVAYAALAAISPAPASVHVVESPRLGQAGGDSVVVAFISDLHVGGSGDYGSEGFDDSFEGDSGANAIHLRRTVDWINENRTAKGISLVIVLGDMTCKAESSELKVALVPGTQ
jgi:hypothetical protein